MKKTFRRALPRNTARALPAQNFIVKPEAGFQWADGYLSQTSNSSVIRIIPALDTQDGVVEEAVALDPYWDPEEKRPSIEALGPVFCQIAVCRLFVQHRAVFFLSTMQDENGMYTDWSVISRFMSRWSWKLEDQRIRSSGRWDVDIPSKMLSWSSPFNSRKRQGETLIDRPLIRVVCQAYALKLDGQVCKDDKDKPHWSGPYVFSIPLSALKTFYTNVLDRKDGQEDQPLSLTNNEYGDFCSLEHGHRITIKKGEEINSNGEKSTVYLMRLGDPTPLTLDLVQKAWKPWDSVLNIMTAEEQVAFLTRLYKNHAPMMLDYALREDSNFCDLIPNDMRGAADEVAEATDDMKRLQQEVASARRSGLKGGRGSSQTQQQQAADTQDTEDASPPAVLEPPEDYENDDIPFDQAGEEQPARTSPMATAQEPIDIDDDGEEATLEGFQNILTDLRAQVNDNNKGD